MKKKSLSKKEESNSIASSSKSEPRRFELVDGKSCKFWEVTQKGCQFTVRFGRIGTEGQEPKTKDMGSLEKARIEVEKLIREKVGKGYVDVTSVKQSPEILYAYTKEKKRNSSSVQTQKLLTEEVANKYLCDDDAVNLSEYKSIEDAAAKLLAGYRGFSLNLRGLTGLSDTSAKHLGTAMCEYLFLDGINKLTDNAAQCLGCFGGSLSLNGLQTLSRIAARGLGQGRIRSLSLNGLKSLSGSIAEGLKLSEDAHNLGLNGLINLSESAAAALGRIGIKGALQLKGVISLSSKAAQNLVQDRIETLSLDGIVELSAATAASLSRHKGKIHLNGMKRLSDTAAEHLGKHKGMLWLNGLKSLSVKAAECLSNHECGSLEPGYIELSLSGLSQLSDEAAINLARHRGSLLLSELCIDNLSEKALQAISQHSGLDASDYSVRVKAKLKEAKKRASKSFTCSPYPQLANVRKTGATILRSIWEGYGDDGCFSHQLFKNGKNIELKGEVEADVETVVEENGLTVDGMMNGSVGILEIDLVSGQAAFWNAEQAAESQRFAEFLLRCQWAQAVSLAASIRMLVDADDRPEQEVTSLTTDPVSAKKVLQPELETLLYRIDHLEGGEELMEKIRCQCGTSVSLTVDVSARTFVFIGNGKKVSVKVAKNELEVTRFKVDLGSSSDTNSKTAKKGVK